MDDKMKITGLMEELMYLIDKNIGTSIQPKADPEAWRAENRKKQAAGVKFECRSSLLPSGWGVGHFEFYGKKENYREVQEATKPTIPPHADKRALYWSQRAAGTNEVWQCIRPDGSVLDIGAILEPCWLPNCKYLVKPKMSM